MNLAQPAQAACRSKGSARDAPTANQGSRTLSTITNKARTGSWWDRLSGRRRDRDLLLPLYEAIVAVGRDPLWYRAGRVPDTVDGRFDMIAAVTAIVLIRMEAMAGEVAAKASVMLTELFIADMDESLRQIGIGDYVVGKHMGKMIGALGGRLGAFRQAAADGDYLAPVTRNIFDEAPPSADAAALVANRLRLFAADLQALDLDALVAGRLPRP